MEEEDNLKLLFLSSVTRKYLPSSCIKLRSYYNSLLVQTANISQVKLSKNVTNRNAACPYCCFPWSHNTASIKLFPSVKSKCIKVKIDESDGIKKQRNKLVVKCKVCNQKSPFSLIKKIKKPLIKNVVATETVTKTSKKKRKKDKTCGLKKSAINQVKLKTEAQSIIKVDNKEKNLSTKKKNTESSQFSLEEKLNINRHKFEKTSIKSKKEAKKPVAINNQKLVLNPYAAQDQNKTSKKKQKKQLQQLRQAISSGQEPVKNTLKGFLSLVS